MALRQYGRYRLMVATDDGESMGRTSIQVSDELADELYSRKNRGESYEDVIWRLIEDVDASDDIAESGVSATGPDSRPEPDQPPAGTTEQPESALGEVESVLEDVEFPTTKDRGDCVEAVRAAYEYLQENEKATMREFVQEVMPEHPVGYDVPDLEPGERYRGAWWRKVVKPGLNALPDVESPPRGGSDWAYTGDR